MRRLLLVPHAATAATRAAAFARDDEPLDGRGRAAAAGLADVLPARCEVLVSPALRCRETADAAGLASVAVEPALAECDWGVWTGRMLVDVQAAEPEAFAAWTTDPHARPHGGESLAAMAARVGGWLERQASLDGTAVAITHASVVKAALVQALGSPPDAFWRIDAAPLCVTELHARDGRWTVTRVNAAVATGGSQAAPPLAARDASGDGQPDAVTRQPDARPPAGRGAHASEAA